MVWTNDTYPLSRMITDLTTGLRAEYYVEELAGYTEQQIRDLYADTFPPFQGFD